MTDRQELEQKLREAQDRVAWLLRKIDGARVEELLAEQPVGAEFRLSNISRAYDALYRKNDQGRWDQVDAFERPLVYSMSPDHLGFAVGYQPIADALVPTPRTDAEAAWERSN